MLDSGFTSAAFFVELARNSASTASSLARRNGGLSRGASPSALTSFPRFQLAPDAETHPTETRHFSAPRPFGVSTTRWRSRWNCTYRPSKACARGMKRHYSIILRNMLSPAHRHVSTPAHRSQVNLFSDLNFLGFDVNIHRPFGFWHLSCLSRAIVPFQCE